MPTSELGKLLLILAGVLGLAGLFLLLVASASGGPPVGRLPGDIFIRRGGFSLYLPLASCLLISLLLTVLLSLLGWLVRR